MISLRGAHTFSISVNCPPDKVYRFIYNPENLPLWAPGFCKSIKKSDSGWTVETAQGAVAFRFVERNTFGVLDHFVTVAPHMEIYVPMRVVANGTGSEVIFTLFRLPDMPDEIFADDVKLVEGDLMQLKSILEHLP